MGDSRRVIKGCARLEACGNVDELNAVLGLCREENDNKLIGAILRRLQGELFMIGADLAMPIGGKTQTKATRISGKFTARLEKEIDEIQKKLPPLKNFILPAGSDEACFLHLARTVCRRAERSVAALMESSRGKSAREIINPQIIVYLNRLGDLLFVLARLTNKAKEERWVG